MPQLPLPLPTNRAFVVQLRAQPPGPRLHATAQCSFCVERVRAATVACDDGHLEIQCRPRLSKPFSKPLRRRRALLPFYRLQRSPQRSELLQRR
jgi:hypothetical protein